ncbi:hypothetical protein MBLNU13_g04337t2 [Cladosporium sp. NU13]
MGEPLPPPQQQCAAPLPARPEEEALHLDHSTPASTDRQPPMQTSADAAAASTHADRQTEPPAFWNTRHSRTASYHSISHLGPGTIQLVDHSEEQHEQSQGCWARSVTVDDYTVVSGSSGLGAYVVWSLTVSTLKGGDMSIRKRYSEFDHLRENLVKAFPHAEGSIPQLPRKSVVSRFRPRFLEQRKNGLSHFIRSAVVWNLVASTGELNPPWHNSLRNRISSGQCVSARLLTSTLPRRV